MVNEDVRLLCNYRRMKSIRRCNNFPTVVDEDVAQHSFYVAILCMFFGDEYNQYVTENELEVDKVNMEILLRKAALHDTEESLTSDIPWNIKHSTPELYAALKVSISNKLDDVYENASDVANYYRSLCETCKDNLEGAIVGAADMLELALYCYEEYNKGNKYVEGLLIKCIGLFDKNPMYNKLYESSNMFRGLVELIKNYEDSSLVEIIDVK